MTAAAVPLTPAPAAVGPASMVPVAYRVTACREETADTFTLDVEPVGAALADPAPGQFAMVWSPGVGEVPISVAGLLPPAGAAPTWQFTIRAVGATTRRLVATPVGSVLGLRGPFGHGWSPVPVDRPAVVVAGGVGLAPLRLHIEALLAQVAAGGRAPVSIVVGARTPEDLLYRDELERWGGTAAVHVTVDRASAGWTGEVGLVTAPLGRLALTSDTITADTAAALCGPEIMMRFAAADLVTAGVPADSVEVSLERSMACAIAHCGRCQIGPVMVCRDGPVMPWSGAAPLMEVRRW